MSNITSIRIEEQGKFLKNTKAYKLTRTPYGDDIFFNGYTLKGLKKGDIILRPIIEDSPLDKLLNKALPGEYEHASIYLGDGKVLNIYPDSAGAIHEEDIFCFMSWYKEFRESPDKYTIIRLTNDPSIVKKALDWLKTSQNKKARFNNAPWGLGKKTSTPDGTIFYGSINCVTGITEAFISAGLKRTDLQLHDQKGLPCLGSFSVNNFDTGYELYAHAVKTLKFRKN